MSCRMLEGGQNDTVLKQSQQFLLHTSQHIAFQCLFQEIVFDSTHSNCSLWSSFTIRAHTKGKSLFCFKIVSGALVCLARRSCPSCRLQSREGYARRFPTIKTANSHILPLFWPYFAEWCFSFFLEVGVYLTLPFREL